MVAKPDVHSPATAPDEEPLEHDPLSLPIRLEFGPVLEALAEAGYVGERLNEWLIYFNRANKDTIGKLELDAEGRLLVTPMQSREGSRSEGRMFLELGLWAREYGGEAHGSRLGVELPSGARYAADAAWLSPEQLADYEASGRTWLVRFCPHFVAEVMSRNDRPSAAPAQDGRIHRQRRAAGLAHRPLPAAGPRLPPRRRPRHAGRPGAAHRRPPNCPASSSTSAP